MEATTLQQAVVQAPRVLARLVILDLQLSHQEAVVQVVQVSDAAIFGSK